jgi:hypothetical protein
VFGEVPRFTETRVVKLYKGVLGSLFGDLGPFFVGLPLAIVSWQLQRLVGRVPPVALTMDGEELALDTWSTVLVLNGDLGPDFPLGRGVPLAGGSFRVVGLRYRGMRRALEQLKAARDGRILANPERYAAVVRTARSLVVRPLEGHAYMVNVDGLRLPARGQTRVAVAGRVTLIAAPRAAPAADPTASGATSATGEPPAAHHRWSR